MMQAVSVPPTEDKREVLVDCALMVASAVVKWDLGTFEKRYRFRKQKFYHQFFFWLHSGCSEFLLS